MAPPSPRLNAVTLGVRDFAKSVAFYEALGFKRRMRATGDEIAFFQAGAIILALFRWNMLAEDAKIPAEPAPQAFRGTTLAWMCASPAEVDAAFAQALKAGATILKRPQQTSYGPYSGYFADPDGHAWETVQAPKFELLADGRVTLPD